MLRQIHRGWKNRQKVDRVIGATVNNSYDVIFGRRVVRQRWTVAALGFVRRRRRDGVWGDAVCWLALSSWLCFDWMTKKSEK